MKSYLCWREGEVPQDMRDANIVTLNKNKGDKSDYNNYRGIPLLTVIKKLLAWVALERLQVLAERIPRIAMCFPSQQVNHWFGVLPPTAVTEM